MPEPDNGGMHRVLIVEDDQLTALALMRALKDDNLNILAVAEGPSALSEIRTNPYALVFLEVGIADGTGITILREISRFSPSTCVVVMSAGIPDGEAQDTIMEHDHFFLPKPFEVLQVRTMTRKILSRFTRAQQELTSVEEMDRKKRGYVRQSRSGQVIIRSHPERSYPGIPQHFTGQIVDVSTEGMGVRTDLPLPPGQVFCFDDEDRSNNGVVRWSMVFGNRFRAGIQFVKGPGSKFEV